MFDYSAQKISTQEFTMTFSFNFYDIEFLLNKSKVHLKKEEIPHVPSAHYRR